VGKRRRLSSNLKKKSIALKINKERLIGKKSQIKIESIGKKREKDMKEKNRKDKVI
jgi:hypothetical protein